MVVPVVIVVVVVAVFLNPLKAGIASLSVNNSFPPVQMFPMKYYH